MKIVSPIGVVMLVLTVYVTVTFFLISFHLATSGHDDSCHSSFHNSEQGGICNKLKSDQLPSERNEYPLSKKIKRWEAPKANLRPWCDPPPPIITGQQWNASHIEWVGRNFYFPPPFHMYTPHQIQKAFRHHSILMHGDSTVRRFYAFLHNVLSLDVVEGKSSWTLPNTMKNVTTVTLRRRPDDARRTLLRESFLQKEIVRNSSKIDEIISALLSEPMPIDTNYLDHRFIIDVNKGTFTEGCHKTPGPYWQRENQYLLCRPHPTGGWEQPLVPSPYSALEYDYVNTACLGSILDFLTLDEEYLHHVTRMYSIYFVGVGVWETTKKDECSRQGYHDDNWPDGLYRLLHDVLVKLSHFQSSHLMVVWRTSGYYNNRPAVKYNYILREMNRQAVAFIDEFNARNSNSNLTYLDWGLAMEERSEGEKRLAGDMAAHYAIEARVLQTQMFTNILYEKIEGRNV